MEYPKFYLPDEIIYDDCFKFSLFDVFDLNCPRTPKDLKILLDKSGYFGRHQLIQSRLKGRKADSYRLKIYLPSSKATYMWPFLTNFSFDGLDNVYKKYKKIPRCIADVFDFFPYGRSLNIFDVIKEVDIGTFKEVSNSIDLLHKIGLFKLNRNLIKDVQDRKEIYLNLIKIKP